MDYQIVPISPVHIPGFHKAVDFVARERKYLAFLEAPPLPQAEAFVRQNIERGYSQFVVVSGEEVVGWCDVIPMTDRPVYSHTGVLGVGLLPPFRGRGIGSELMRQTIAGALAGGLTRIELTVRAGNENAMNLYKKLGFEVEGLKKNAVRIDGVYENLYLMALLPEGGA